jgi:post-segregation antitoxin (ccd killing protein)
MTAAAAKSHRNDGRSQTLRKPFELRRPGDPSSSTFTLDEELAKRARQLGVNISAAARQGVADAVRAALVRADRDAYLRKPEREDAVWDEVEAWGKP